MVADAYKKLYQGQLGASVAQLGTAVGTGKGWVIKRYRCVNNDTVARTFSLYQGGTAAANIITPPNTSVPAGGMVEDDGTWSVNDADTIAGGASVASQLTLTIWGDEVKY
jgi:hypothetical protein